VKKQVEYTRNSGNGRQVIIGNRLLFEDIV